jgi:hypothetical protein
VIESGEIPVILSKVGSSGGLSVSIREAWPLTALSHATGTRSCWPDLFITRVVRTAWASACPPRDQHGQSTRVRCCPVVCAANVTQLERPAIGMCQACRNRAQARVPMIIGLPQSMIFEVSRACRAIMPAGAGLGRVLCPAR